MNPEQLHQRILLHELRTILLDETRQGDPIPDNWKAAIQEDPHRKTPYLVLADWLDEQGSDLAELCRIQCELIDLLPIDLFMENRYELNAGHPFNRDAVAIIHRGERHTIDLVTRRFHLTLPLYSELQKVERLTPLVDPEDDEGVSFHRPERYRHDLRPHKLGRTTRMLTDVLRYCALIQEKNVLVSGIGADHAARLLMDTQDLAYHLAREQVIPIPRAELPLWGNRVVFTSPHSSSIQLPPDTTFTDHACQDTASAREHISEALTQGEGRLTCRCGQPGEEPHTCPYAVDINHDSENLCNCCSDCTAQCAWDI